MPIDIIVVTCDSSQWIPDFWRSLLVSLKKANGCVHGRLIVADSGSTDQTLQVVRDMGGDGGEVVVRECGHIGFGAAANQGLKLCQSEWVLICNPDLTFTENFFIELQNVIARHPDKGRISCLAPRLYHPNGSVQASVGAFPSVWGIVKDQFRARTMRKYLSIQPDALQEIDWATGACLAFKRRVLEQVGGFDEHYFLYVEEVDLQKRLRAAGFEIVFAPQLGVIHHQPNAARPKQDHIQKYAARGNLRYFAKYSSWVTLWMYRLMALVSGRLSVREVFLSRSEILQQRTGP